MRTPEFWPVTMLEPGRRQPALPDRVAARALALAIDPTTPTETAAEALIRLARGNPVALDRALRRIALWGAERPSHLTAAAADALGLALGRLASAPRVAASTDPPDG